MKKAKHSCGFSRVHLAFWFLFSLSFTVVTATGKASAQTVDIPVAQQRPPATLESQYPYRPACIQLIPQLSQTNPNFTAWGPVIQGEHQSWYGLPTRMPIEKSLVHLNSAGLCVQGGEVVPWEIAGGVVAAAGIGSPKDRAVERLKAAPDNPDSNNSFTSFILLAAAAFGALHLYERFENQSWVRRLSGETITHHRPPEKMSPRLPASRSTPHLPAATAIPDRVSRDDLHDARPDAPKRLRTALSVLAASPYVSRAIYGWQRTGKTNLVISVLRPLSKQGVQIFTINLYSFGSEDDEYTKGFKSVRGDLLTITDKETAVALVQDAINLAEEFIQYPGPAILLCDEWAGITGSYGRYVDLLEPLIKDLADKISGFASSGIKRKKALWTIAPEIVAGTMETVGKSVKKLSVCLVGIAPGHTEYWEGEELTFSWELYQQVAKNYPNVLSPPPEDSEHSRIAFVNGEWLPLGTKALVGATATVEAKEVNNDQPSDTSDAFPLPAELTLFRDWLDKKTGTVIDYSSFNNANCFRKISRSKENYIQLCDKAIMKGWLSQRSEETFFVFE